MRGNFSIMKTKENFSFENLWPIVAVIVLLVGSFFVFRLLPARDGLSPEAATDVKQDAKKKLGETKSATESLLRASEATVDHEYMVLGKSKKMKLRRDLLKLEKVYEDGTTQYDYNHGEMVVTIQSSGEVLLLPKEI